VVVAFCRSVGVQGCCSRNGTRDEEEEKMKGRGGEGIVQSQLEGWWENVNTSWAYAHVRTGASHAEVRSSERDSEGILTRS
jgi:hypothetical protein